MDTYRTEVVRVAFSAMRRQASPYLVMLFALRGVVIDPFLACCNNVFREMRRAFRSATVRQDALDLWAECPAGAPNGPLHTLNDVFNRLGWTRSGLKVSRPHDTDLPLVNAAHNWWWHEIRRGYRYYLANLVPPRHDTVGLAGHHVAMLATTFCVMGSRGKSKGGLLLHLAFSVALTVLASATCSKDCSLDRYAPCERSSKPRWSNHPCAQCVMKKKRITSTSIADVQLLSTGGTAVPNVRAVPGSRWCLVRLTVCASPVSLSSSRGSPTNVPSLPL